MKNKYMKKTYYIIFLLLFVVCKTSSANEINFDTAKIEISNNGNTITALDGEAISITDKIKIKGEKFVYEKDLSSLSAFGNLFITNNSQNIRIEAETIFYDLNKKIIFSNQPSTMYDDFGNQYFMRDFNYEIQKGIIKINDAKIVDKEKNIMNLDLAFLNLISNKLLAKDILLNLNSVSYNKENNTRIAGNSLTYENNKSIISKGVFTTCKKDGNCPPWQLTAQEIKHDKLNKTIIYKNAWLKLYDKPVFYFPKFFHPDPTVKRRSGFLIPTTSDSSSNGTSFNIPYFYALSDNKDLTFSPRIYFGNKQLIQTEYRQVNKNSKNTSDFSVFNQSEKGETNSHFFTKFVKNLKLNMFEDSNIDLQLQQTSGDTYLKKLKMKSPLIVDTSTLTSNLSFDAFREDFSLYADLRSYEDLTKIKSDRYEFIPNYRLSKKIFRENEYNGNFTFESKGHLKHYNTNVSEQTLINDLNFASNSEINEYGFKNNFNLFLKNANKKTKNPSKSIDNDNFKLASLFEYRSAYPLIKELSNATNLLIPSASFKFSPNETASMKDEDRRIDINNVFSSNRISSDETVEGGESLTFGTEFINTNSQDEELLNIKLANSVRLKENKNLPTKSSIGKKTSDLFGQIIYSPSKVLKINYDFSLDENLQDQNYQLVKTSIEVNNFVTSFSYLDENFSTSANNKGYLENETTYKLDNARDFSFKTRRNKKTSLTEFYNLIYSYRNDCLIASLEYNKDFYEDRGIEPEENIFFKLTIVPFGETQTPDIMMNK